MESQKQGPYHHGQLRQALLDAALQLITERGIDSLTLREVARQAGVSHAAPYHHFADKSALIEAVVVESFHAFATVLRESTIPSGNALDNLIALGKAYVCFAGEHSASFRLMYRPELRQPSLPQEQEHPGMPSVIDEAALEAYQVLAERIRACQEAGFIPVGSLTPLTLTAWSTVHGVAVLLLDGSLGSFLGEGQNREEVDRLSERVIQTLLHGFLVR